MRGKFDLGLGIRDQVLPGCCPNLLFALRPFPLFSESRVCDSLMSDVYHLTAWITVKINIFHHSAISSKINIQKQILGS